MLTAKTLIVGSAPTLIAEEKSRVRVVATGQDVYLGDETLNSDIVNGKGNHFLLKQSVPDRKEDPNDSQRVTSVGSYFALDLDLGPGESLYAVSANALHSSRVYVLSQG